MVLRLPRSTADHCPRQGFVRKLLFAPAFASLLALSPTQVGSWAVAAERNQRASGAVASAAPAEVSPSAGLTLADLLALAQENNPTLAQAGAAINQAEGNMRQAGLYPNPQLGYLHTDSSPSGRARTDGVFFGQEIVTAGKLRKSRAVEAQEVERVRWEREAQQQRVLNDVEIRFYEVLGSQQAVRIATQLARLAEDGLTTTQKLHDAQQASRVDLLQARIQLKAVRLSLLEAQARYSAAWTQLANVAGCPELQPMRLVGDLEGEIREFDWEETWQRLLAASPQLRAAEFRIEHARCELQREKAQPIPNVNLQVVAERDRLQQFTTVSTLLAIPLPLFNRNQGNISHAVADIHEALAEVRRTQLALRDQLTETFRRYQTARRQVEQLRDEILPDAKESVQLTMDGYKAGEINFLQVLSARQTFGETSLTYVESLTELRKVIVELNGLLLTGGLNPAELGAALQAQPGGGRQRGLLNQLRESNSRQVLIPALQTSGSGR